MFEFAVFWIFAAILVIAASCVIMVRNPVHSALFLVLAFFTAAALWMLLRAEFLAIALVLVYVGAVMVLFLFVVMMLDINLERSEEHTSELQSQSNLVCRLLLEKKKKDVDTVSVN